MTTPKRIRLRRTAGWRLPENARSVARPGRYGNPFPIGREGPLGRIAPDAAGAVGFFRAMLKDPELRAAADYPSDDEIRADLRGCDLGCWCQERSACHADVLIEVANGGGA